MAETVTKDQALAAIDAERDTWRQLIADVGVDRMDEPGPMGDWTFKDLAAHLTGWRQHSIARIEAVQRDEPVPPTPWPAELTEDDDINAWIYARERDRPVDAVLADAEATFDRLRAAVEPMGDEQLNDPGRFPWMESRSLGDVLVSRYYFAHLHDEHMADIRAWLASRNGGGAA
jgi:hypothetical protein